MKTCSHKSTIWKEDSVSCNPLSQSLWRTKRKMRRKKKTNLKRNMIKKITETKKKAWRTILRRFKMSPNTLLFLDSSKIEGSRLRRLHQRIHYQNRQLKKIKRLQDRPFKVTQVAKWAAPMELKTSISRTLQPVESISGKTAGW